MTIDIETLLASVSPEDPCGPDLTYDLQRQDLEHFFGSDVSIAMSGQAGEEEKVNWPQVVTKLLEQFARSKDLWLATSLCRAAASGGDLDTVALGADVLAGLMERYWPEVHPRIDEVDLIGRRSVCDPLSNRRAFLDPLSRVPIFVHPRLGAFSGADLIRLRKDLEADPNYGLFRQALSEQGDAQLQTASQTLARIQSALKRAEKVFAENSGGELLLNFDATYEAIRDLQNAIAAFAATPVAPEAGQDQAKPAAATSAGPPGAIGSRDDVIRSINAICDYYRQREPSSPVLALMTRAKAWVPMSFLDVLADIAPDSIDAVKQVLLNKNND